MDHNAHSVYLMYYHLIMVVKHRRKVINDPISERAKEIWEYIAPRYGIILEEWHHDIDHVHVMFRAQPKTELSKFINAYKSASSRLLKKEYPEIREKLWKEAFWSQSFCLLTAGGAPVEVIRQYIKTQGEKSDSNNSRTLQKQGFVYSLKASKKQFLLAFLIVTPPHFLYILVLGELLIINIRSERR